MNRLMNETGAPAAEETKKAPPFARKAPPAPGKAPGKAPPFQKKAAPTKEVAVDDYDDEGNEVGEDGVEVLDKSDPAVEGMAEEGRMGDTELAHLTPGELVVPISLQTPRLMSVVASEFKEAGVPMERYIVGSSESSENPETGQEEYGLGSIVKKLVGVAAPVIGNFIAPGIGGVIGGAAGSLLGGGAEEGMAEGGQQMAANAAAAPQKPSLSVRSLNDSGNGTPVVRNNVALITDTGDETNPFEGSATPPLAQDRRDTNSVNPATGFPEFFDLGSSIGAVSRLLSEQIGKGGAPAPQPGATPAPRAGVPMNQALRDFGAPGGYGDIRNLNVMQNGQRVSPFFAAQLRDMILSGQGSPSPEFDGSQFSVAGADGRMTPLSDYQIQDPNSEGMMRNPLSRGPAPAPMTQGETGGPTAAPALARDPNAMGVAGSIAAGGPVPTGAGRLMEAGPSGPNVNPFTGKQEFWDAESYYQANPDVRAAGMDSLQHYNTYGKKEGRDIGTVNKKDYDLRQSLGYGTYGPEGDGQAWKAFADANPDKFLTYAQQKSQFAPGWRPAAGWNDQLSNALNQQLGYTNPNTYRSIGTGYIGVDPLAGDPTKQQKYASTRQLFDPSYAYATSQWLPSDWDENSYYNLNPDIKGAVDRGDVNSGGQQYFLWGQQAGRKYQAPKAPTTPDYSQVFENMMSRYTAPTVSPANQATPYSNASTLTPRRPARFRSRRNRGTLAENF